MQNKSLAILPALLAIVMLTSGCEVIGGIFKAGAWTGAIVVILILVIVIWIIAKVFSKNK
ncbi:MAG: phosphatidate cytidylyltransferase [Ferruginibacter sp.]